jgi:4-hydroxy-tetrahydrodipicolinate synthase
LLPERNCLAAAIATPLTADLRPDAAVLLDHARWLMASGCDGITLFGTTGEGPEFSLEDRISTLDALVSAGIDPSRIIVSITALTIPDIVRLAVHAIECGVHGVLLMPPCVFRSGITEDGTFHFFDVVISRIARSDLRLYLYHFPDICGVPITPQVVRRLDERYPGQIAGVKDSGGDEGYTEVLVRSFSHLSIFTGSETHLPHLLSVGVRGTVCGMANVMPRLMRAMMNEPTAFDRRKVLPHLLRADTFLSRRAFIASAKTVLADVNDAAAWRRVVPPMSELPVAERQRLIADFRAWDAGLPPAMQSIASPMATNNVVDLRRA